MQKQIIAHLNKIPKLSKDLAKTLVGGEIFALIGPLGSGKTTFAKALAKELKIKHTITSPTFSIMNVYPAKLAKGKKKVHFYHLDLYRTENFKEVKALGLTEIWGNENTVTLIEWADKIKKYLPKNTIWIQFENEKTVN